MKLKIGGAAGRFGVRYGQMVRRKIADIESRQRKKQVCPFCSGRAIRTSKGIWNCKKCGKKFAAHAYYLEGKMQVSPFEKTKPLKEQEASSVQEKIKKSRVEKKSKSKKAKETKE